MKWLQYTYVVFNSLFYVPYMYHNGSKDVYFELENPVVGPSRSAGPATVIPGRAEFARPQS